MSIKPKTSKISDEIISYEARISYSKEIQKITGKKCKTKNFKTELEAKKWIKEKQQEIDLNMFNLNEGMTFGDLINKFTENKIKTWSKNTFPTFSGFVKNYFNPALSKILINDFCKYDLFRFKKFLDSKDLSDKTKHNICTALRSIIKFGILENYIDNTGILLFIPKYSQQLSESKDYYLKVNQCIELVEIMDIEILRDIVLFLFNSGLRISELCGLRFSDIDFQNETLTVNNQIYYERDNWELKPAKCRRQKKPDTIRVNSIVLSIADKYKKLKKADINEFVFTDFKNQPFRKDGFIKFHFDKAVLKAKALNIINKDDKISLHTLRHSFLTNLSMKNENPKKLQELARHKDYSFTYNRYVAKDLKDKPESLTELENDFKNYINKH